ncbi:MAG: RHS repeat domain-containing protein [Bryobacteraceae bacterium]
MGFAERLRLMSGDGQLISVSYFDSRGLAWLSIESENGLVPSSGCFSGCAKVERRSVVKPVYLFEATSNPYRGNSDTDTRGFTLTTKDAAGRVRDVTGYSGLAASGWPWTAGATSMGSTLTSYNGETTTMQDPAGKTRTLSVDGVGRLTSANAGSLAATVNTYDSLGNVRQVTQGTQVRTFTYSSLARLVAATQPENGTTGYTYDDNGNALKRTNGALKVFEFKPPIAAPSEKAYDGLNRPRRKSIQQPAGADVDITWTWDTATSNGKGQLGSVSYGDTTVSYSGYDSLGRVTSHAQTTAAISYPFAYEYYWNDELQTITYPSGRAVSYTLDNAGRAVGASAGTTSYIGAATYAPHGGLRQIDLGGTNKLRANWSTINGRLQLEQFTVSKLSSPAATLMGLGYSYGGSANNGNPMSQTVNDSPTGAAAAARTQSYVYDAANRLDKACEANTGVTGCTVNSSATWTGAGYGQAYGYDAYSNRWIEPTGTVPTLILQPTSAAAFESSTNRFNTALFGGTYDGAGQMTAQFAASTSIIRADEKWDAAGQRVESLYTYSGVSNTNTMVYDGLGNRVKKNNPVVGDTVYVYDAFGQLAAEYGAGATTVCAPCYLFADPVGSMRLVVDQNQVVVKRYDSMPFGEQISAGTGWANGRTGAEYSPISTVKWRFASSYKDDQSSEWPANLMGVRQYNPGYGRFVTPDENLVDQDAGDPLSWNLYGYGRNNPLRYSDPSGRKCVNNLDSESGNWCVDVEAVKEKVQTVKKVATVSLLLLEPTVRLPGAMAEQTMEAAKDWMGRPRDPGCMAGLMGAGSAAGFWAGGGLGSAGFAGGPAGLATVPAGAGAGAAGGGALGGAAGLVICSTGGGGGSGGGFKKPKAGISGKEGSKDAPSWAAGQRPYVGENGNQFAQRLLDAKYGKVNHDKGPTSEFNRIKKWGDRNFE